MFARPFFRVARLNRGFATHAGPNAALPAVLHLKTGQSFTGRSFGAPRSIFGETVFSTSITSCTFPTTSFFIRCHSTRICEPDLSIFIFYFAQTPNQ